MCACNQSLADNFKLSNSTESLLKYMIIQQNKVYMRLNEFMPNLKSNWVTNPTPPRELILSEIFLRQLLQLQGILVVFLG